jgi:hypothetical protein
MKELYNTANGTTFVIVREWLEEEDPWVEYENIKTLQRYTCRKAALLERTVRQVLA